MYFRRILFVGAENLPPDKPVILISNHSASFLDAMILGALLKRAIWFFSRGDVFRKPVFNKLLRSLHMIPIYNHQHGKDEMHKNEQTFLEGMKVLQNRHVLLIFPEGISRQERVLLPLKKGTARVALQTVTEMENMDDLLVIPLGINYSKHEFRADLSLCIGEPTVVANYKSLHLEQPNKAVNLLNQELEQKFSRMVWHVDQPERSDLLVRMIEYFRNDHYPGILQRGDEKEMKMEMELCDQVSALDTLKADRLDKQSKKYEDLLKENKFSDLSINGNYRFIVVHSLLLIVSLPIILAGILLCGLPLYLAKWVADNRVTRIDFYTSVEAAVGGFGFLLWWILLFLIALIIGNSYFTIIVLLAPLLGLISLHGVEAIRAWDAHRRYLKAQRKNPSLVDEVKALRQEISFWKK